MPVSVWVMTGLFVAAGSFAVPSLLRDLRTGVAHPIGSLEVSAYDRPFCFNMLIAARISLVALGVASALYVLGLIGA